MTVNKLGIPYLKFAMKVMAKKSQFFNFKSCVVLFFYIYLQLITIQEY